MIICRKILIFSIVLGLLSGVTLFAGWWQVDGPGALKSIDKKPLPLIEMSFQLTDNKGEIVSPETLIGKATLVFFGFTYCPDVCPTTLSDISGWLDSIGKDSDDLNVIFITVDPDRDTVEVMDEYVKHFHPAIRGWTGTAEEVAQVAVEFGVTYLKEINGGNDYIMNHTASIFIFNNDGRFVSTIDNHELREIAMQKIQRVM